MQQKREISEAVQQILAETNHPELPKSGEINFLLHVDGAESWSWVDIRNNGSVASPGALPWNERQIDKHEEQKHDDQRFNKIPIRKTTKLP